MRELNAYWDFRILVHVDAGISIARAVERDFDGTGETEIIRRRYEQRYEPAWLIYRDLERPERKADVIIDNEDFARPLFLKGGFTAQA